MAQVTEVTATKKLQIQLGVPFFILTGFAVTVLIFGTIFFGTTLGGERDGIQPEPRASALSSAISSEIEQYYNRLKPVAAVSIENVFEKEQDDSFRELLSTNKEMLAVVFFDAEGNRVTDLHKSRISDTALNRASNGLTYLGVLKSAQGPFSTVVQTDGAAPLLFVAFPSFESGGTLRSYIVVVSETDWLTDMLQSEVSNTLLKVTVADSRTGATLLSKSTLPSTVVAERPTNDVINNLFETNKKKFGYETQEGITLVGAWEPVVGTHWNLIVEGFTPTKGNNNIAVFAVGGVLILIFIGLTFLFISIFNTKLLTPLKRIEKAIQYYKSGDYSEEVKLDTKNELRGIADALNTFARHIENNTSERVTQLKKVLDRQNTDTKLLIEKDVELREKSQKLKELDAAKSMFVSVAAHQMRTPLAAVKWAIKLVMDGDVGPVNAEQKEYLGKGYKSTTRMIDLINDLLDVDKIESDKFTYEFKSESLLEILQGIVDDLTPLAKEKGVKLVFEHDDNPPPISADKVKLTNALQNLIDNAIKYTIGGGDVTVSLVLDKGVFNLTISDTGIGIPLSEQDKVFGKFFRAKNAVRQQTDGSGLGLFIVKKIIEKHQGSVEFESKEKVGTTFHIKIPAIKNN